MNATLKTILLTVLTLSVLTIALIEVSGVSEKSMVNLFKSEQEKKKEEDVKITKKEREDKMKTMEKTVVRVIDSTFSFGEVIEGDTVNHTYIVENVGDKPLFIANVQTSCGCTVPKFSEEPILPGQTGTVLLEFNSTGKRGSVNKKALIIANASNAPYPISFTAEVLAR
jgi:hypothetical protein